MPATSAGMTVDILRQNKKLGRAITPAEPMTPSVI
jgi:hypothetical protein